MNPLAGMQRLGTKTHHERYEEEADRLVRPNPKLKPPRHDLRREQIHTEKDPDADDASDVKDRSRNYKNIGGAVKTSAKDRIPAKSRETGDTVMISPDTLKEQPGKYEPVDEAEQGKAKDEAKAEKGETPEAVPPGAAEKEAYYGKLGDSLRSLAKDNPKLESKLKDFTVPGSQISGMIKENPEFPAAPLFPGIQLPAGLRTLKDVQEALKAKSATPSPAKGKGKKKGPKAPVEAPGKPPEEKAAPAPEAVPEGKEPPSKAPAADPKAPEEAKDEEGPEEPSEEAPPKEPSEAEKAGVSPPKRREYSTVEKREALNAVVGTFPPETAAQVIAANLHPDDLRTLIRKYNAARSSADVGNPSQFAEKVAEFYQTNPSKIAPPEEWGGKALKAMTPEERSEATRQYQVQQMALSFAAKDALTKKLSNPGALLGKPTVPKEMASKLADLMLSKVPPEQASKLADQMFDQTVKSGVLAKMGNGAVKKLLAQVSGNPVAKRVATAWLQANDYQQAKQNFLTSGALSEWDSPGGIIRGLRKANQYFGERNALYGVAHEDHPVSSMFRRRVLNRLETLSPKRASAVQLMIPKLERMEYVAKKKAWGVKFKEWESKREAYEEALRAHQANPKKVKHPGEFTEPEPVKPHEPLSSIDGEDGKSMWEGALKKKAASDSTYPEDITMGRKTSVYHGIAPVAVSYPGWEQPHQREFGDAEAKNVLAEAKDWMASPVLAVAAEGALPDAKFRAALDYALLSTNQKVSPVIYNELLAKLAGKPDPSTEAPTIAEPPPLKLASEPYQPSTGMRASKEIRKFATKVADISLAFEMLAFADHLAEEEEKTQQHSNEKLASESKLVQLRSTIIRKAAELDPTTQAAIKPILQALKDLG